MAGADIRSRIGSSRFDNYQITFTSAGSSCTFHFNETGTDTATDKYYGLGETALAISIYCYKVSNITHMNGKELHDPVLLNIGWNTITKKINLNSITIYSESVDNTIQVLALG